MHTNIILQSFPGIYLDGDVIVVTHDCMDNYIFDVPGIKEHGSHII